MNFKNARVILDVKISVQRWSVSRREKESLHSKDTCRH